mmetsp:Transcript_15700/g.31934  ORF Transcript_15700/g.31934 Transcript_15700/m.31934 type:complete len:92 (+) Transcript_15700:552-827(+)
MMSKSHSLSVSLSRRQRIADVRNVIHSRIKARAPVVVASQAAFPCRVRGAEKDIILVVFLGETRITSTVVRRALPGAMAMRIRHTKTIFVT